LHYARGVFGLHFRKTHFWVGTLGTKEQSNEINNLTRNITWNIIKRGGTLQDIMTSCHFVWLRQAGLKRRLQPVLYIFGKADWIKKTRPKPGLLNLSG